MNRKLHNTVMAMLASSCLLVLGLLTASPLVAPSPATLDAATAVAALDAGESLGNAIYTEVESAKPSPRRHVRRARQQSVAMPFFSFAPRG